MTPSGVDIIESTVCFKATVSMARYTSFTVAVPIDRLRQLLVEFLQCYLEIIYDTADYMMAREIPGQVSYTKLVTVEVLIDKTTATETETRLVIKNEELPLQFDNHHQMFELVNQGIVENRHWQLIEGVAVSCAFGAFILQNQASCWADQCNISYYPMVLLE